MDHLGLLDLPVVNAALQRFASDVHCTEQPED
jgi:hypothetical protein